MSDEHDSWFKDAFGVDLGEVASKVKEEATAVVSQAANTVTQVVQTVEGAVDGAIGTVTSAAAAVVKKAAGAVSGPAPGPAPGASGGGSFPLGGSVGRGGQNAASDVRAVQRALGIGVDGQCGPQTIGAIESYQRQLGQARPDGRVDAGGATERAMASGAPASAPSAASGGADSGGLLDGLKKGASGLIDDAKDLGGKALKGAEEVASGLAGAGAKVLQGVEDAVDDGALLNQLKKPSYVANPDTPPGLQGGGNASAGDSFFVTGQQKGKLTVAVKDIHSAAAAINKLATDLEQKGAKKYWFDDEQMLQSAKNLHGTASAMVKLAKALDLGDVNKESLEKGSTALDHAEKIIGAAEAVGALRNLSLATENLDDKVTEASVNAWADSVGAGFDKAGALIDLIPKGAIPGFVTDYYKGLFSAPKNYIAAFKTLMSIHYGTIDKEVGRSGADHQAEDLGKTGMNWEGFLSTMFVHGYFLPKSQAAKDNDFQHYMQAHRTSEHVDLYKVSLQVGKAVLTAAIQRDLAEDDPALNEWVTHVSGSK